MQGNDLCIADAYMFTTYLIVKYGLEAILSYAMEGNRSFLQTFCIKYENALSEFYTEFDLENVY